MPIGGVTTDHEPLTPLGVRTRKVLVLEQIRERGGRGEVEVTHRIVALAMFRSDPTKLSPAAKKPSQTVAWGEGLRLVVSRRMFAYMGNLQMKFAGFESETF